MTTYNASDFIASLERAAQHNHEIIDRRVERRFVPRIGTVIVTFDRVADYDYADLSYLGHFDNTASDYAVDAQEQVILGEYCDNVYELTQEDIEELTDDQIESVLWRYAEDDGLIRNQWRDSEYTLTIIREGSIFYDYYAHLEFDGYPVLKDGTRYANQRDYDRYFHAENVDGLEGDALTQAIEQNYDRYLSFGDSWDYIGHVVTAYFKGFEIDFASVWGTESDCGDEHSNELFDDLYRDLDLAGGLARVRAELESKLALLSSKEN